MKAVEFNFRIWIQPEDVGSQTIEVWHHELEPTESAVRSTSEWIIDSLTEEDFHALFDLDKDKYWQVLGKGTLRGSYNYDGEYDEEFNILEFEKAEIPADHMGRISPE